MKLGPLTKLDKRNTATFLTMISSANYDLIVIFPFILQKLKTELKNV